MKAYTRALFTQWLLAVAASLMTLLTGMLAQQFCERAYVVFVLFAALFIYRLAYYGWPLKWNAIAAVDRISGIIAGVVMCVTAYYLDEKTLLGLLLTLPACLAYFITLNNWKGLRAVPFMKSIWLAIVWTVVTAFIPLHFSLQQQDLYIVAERLLFMLAICIIYNVRDLHHDFESGVRTVPHRIGVPLTKVICLLILAINFFIIYVHHYPVNIYNGLIVSMALTGCIVLLARKNGNWLYYTLLVDGSMIVQYLLVYFTVHNSVH
jgi:hypothetical protein